MISSTPLTFRARQVWWAIVLLIATDNGFGQEPQIRATLPSPNDNYVGERVVLAVELLAPGVFASAATFDLPDPQGLLLIPPSGSPIVGSEEIGTVNYTVQRHEISLFSRRAGETTIPPITVRFRFKRDPLDQETIAATVKTDPVHLTTKMPPGAGNLGNIVSAKSLTAVETWNPEPGKGKTKAGDAFTRTIVFSSPDVPAMAFPPFPTPPIDGIGIYPKPPEVLDQDERGTLHGERRDRVVYVCQRPGSFVIPAVQLTWWDLEAKQLRTIDFPARTFDVLPNPAMRAATATESTGSAAFDLHAVAIVLGSGSFLVGTLLLLRRIWPKVRAFFRPTYLAPLNPLPDQSPK